jgi:hypothetical protein
MKKIYAVSSGSYSDYRVDALFSSRKLAEEFMSLVNDNDYNDIEEYELDPPTANLIKRGYSVWRVHMLKDGTTERVERMGNDKYDVTNIGHSIWERTKAPAYRGKGIPDILTSTVWAKTGKQAVKIVNEKRTQMIAEGKWT